MTLFPVSSLGNTPAGRLDKIQQLINMGLMQKEDAIDALEFQI